MYILYVCPPLHVFVHPSYAIYSHTNHQRSEVAPRPNALGVANRIYHLYSLALAHPASSDNISTFTNVQVLDTRAVHCVHCFFSCVCARRALVDIRHHPGGGLECTGSTGYSSLPPQE